MIGYDYTSRIAPQYLIAAGCTAVFRYLSTVGNPKNLTRPEALELLTARIGIVLNYETTAGFMLGGYSAGLADARSARAQATDLGAPAGTRIYYSADFDATPAQVTACLDFLHGCADAEGSKQLVGCYGGYAVCKAAADAGFAIWQTVAWSAGQWDPRTVARQTGSQAYIGGVQVDVNELQTLQLGQWGAGAQLSLLEDGMILHAITGSTEIWALSGGLYWHVADPGSLTAYRAIGVPEVTISAGEHADILAAAAAQRPQVTGTMTLSGTVTGTGTVS